MDLSVIIINYNTFQLTCNCIQSLYDKLTDISFEIILVDNASVECNASLFKLKFPNIILISNQINTGFTGGNNSGINASSGDYLLLLNSDTELINNAPKICINYLKQHEKVGLVSAQLQYPNGKIQYTCRRFRTIKWELLEIFPLYLLWTKQKKDRIMLHHYFDHKSNIKTDWVWGAFMLFSKTLIHQLPNKKLNNEFFMYCEDTLWCYEIYKLGYEIHFLSEAKVMHIHRGSVVKNKWMWIRKTTIKNQLILTRKYYTNWRWYIFASIYLTKQSAGLLWAKLKA